jgi:hypothetical protein
LLFYQIISKLLTKNIIMLKSNILAADLFNKALFVLNTSSEIGLNANKTNSFNINAYLSRRVEW